MAHTVVAAIEQLRTLNVIAFQKKYQQVFGEDSRSSNKQYPFRRIAWRFQANAEGGLSERACHRAVQIADEADLRTREPTGFLSAQVSAASTVDHPQAQRDARLPL